LPEEVRLRDPSTPWKSIIGLRNIIAHNYDEVNLTEVWEIVTKHLSQTKIQIQKLASTIDYQKKDF